MLRPPIKVLLSSKIFVYDDASKNTRMLVSRQRGRGRWQKKQNSIKITQLIGVENKLNDILKA
jgi:hypothetical protein